jgi:hypothetical protein
VVDFYDVEPALLAKRHDPHIVRAVAAWLCRRHTEATLGELAEWLGLSRADSVPNLTRRFQAQLKSQPELLNDLEEQAPEGAVQNQKQRLTPRSTTTRVGSRLDWKMQVNAMRRLWMRKAKIGYLPIRPRPDDVESSPGCQHTFHERRDIVSARAGIGVFSHNAVP